MMEEWRNIEGYEGDYMVSNWGNVKSLERLDSLGHLRKERILKPLKSDKGYLNVRLFKNGKGKWFYVHRLVAMAFLPNTDNLTEVNHKDECKSNNNVDNLEWCNHCYNLTYGSRIKQVSDKMTNGKLSKKVYQYSLDDEFVKEYPSTHEVERQLDFDSSYIRACCRGKYKTAYGYKWSYN